MVGVIKSLLFRLVGRRLYNRCAPVWRRYFKYPAIADVFDKQKMHKKRALVIYLSQPFFAPEPTDPANRHANLQWSLVLADALDEKGYVVDVLDLRSDRPLPSSKYDLIIGCGKRFYDLPRQNGTTLVYLATGCEGSFQRDQQTARVEALRLRRGVRGESIPVSENDGQRIANCDAVMSVGNEFTSSTYDDFSQRIFPLPNIGFSFIDKLERDFATARNKYLFLGSRGQVHKGLDLLLEAFADNADLELYICASVEAEPVFQKCYERELYHLTNVHFVGRIDLASEQFREIARACAFVVLPSCAEGMSGSVISAMQTGLIPLVSETSGIDVGEFGKLLQPCTIPTIQEVIRSVSDLPTKQLERQSAAAREATELCFSPENLRREICDVLGSLAALKTGQ